MTGFHWISGSFQTSCKAQDCEKPRAGFLRTLQFLNSLESSPGYNNRTGAKDLAPEKSLIQVMTRINRKNSVKYQVWHREKRQTYDFRLEIIVPHLIDSASQCPIPNQAAQTYLQSLHRSSCPMGSLSRRTNGSQQLAFHIFSSSERQSPANAVPLRGTLQLQACMTFTITHFFPPLCPPSERDQNSFPPVTFCFICPTGCGSVSVKATESQARAAMPEPSG